MNLQPEILNQLSPETLAALMEFYEEKNIIAKEDDYEKIDEDWELSQFWYTNETADNIINLIGNYAEKNKKLNIALLCTPSLYKAYLRNKNKFENLNVALFEFDKRFSIFGDDFNFYDLNKPLEIDKIHHKKYDIIVTDPPFLNSETIHKITETMRFSKANTSITVITHHLPLHVFYA